MVVALITAGVVAYVFVGIIAGKVAYKAVEDSYFWDQSVAAVLAFALWPAALLCVYLSKAADALLASVETRKQAKILAKESAKVTDKDKAKIPKARVVNR